MSILSPLGARTLPASSYAGYGPTDSKANQAATSKPAGVTAADAPTSLSSDGIDLQKRLDAVSSNTVDYAQNLLGSFAQQLFGDAGKGATISFDSASLQASSSYAVGVQHSESASGTTDSAALQLDDSSHFLGKGTITTADGRKFDFEIEVQYSYELQASASETQGSDATQGQPPATSATPTTPASTAPASSAGGSAPAGGDQPASASNDSLPTVQFPNIDFPGTLADLFKLIGHDLQGTLATPGDGKNQGGSIDRNTLRSLSLRLLSLADHKSNDTYSASKAKSVADAYGSTQDAANAAQASTGGSAAPAAAAAPAPAPAAASDAATPAADANTASDTA